MPRQRNPSPFRPTAAEIARARGKAIPDVIAPGLRVLFVGINPSLYSAAVGHHFARPGNRFWPTLALSGFTERLYSAFEDRRLLGRGCGVTNIARPATARADELTPDDLRTGARLLVRKVGRYRPAFVTFLGITAYREAFGCKDAGMGKQPEALGGSCLWVLPNPSGLNAHYQLDGLARLFRELHRAAFGD